MIKEEKDKVSMILFGNKCDLEAERKVTKEEAEQFAKKYRIPYFETSENLQDNIKEGFSILFNNAYEKFGPYLDIKLKKKARNKSKGCWKNIYLFNE